MDVSFRRVRESDLKRLNDLVNDTDVARYLSITPPISMRSTRQLYDRMRGGGRWFAILVDDAVEGSYMLRPKDRDKQRHVADFGINVSRRCWGVGVGASAMAHMLAQARLMGLRRVELEVVEGNARARRLYKSSGFAREGRKRRAFKVGGSFCDSIVMGRLL